MPGIRFSLSILSEKVHVYLSLYSLTLLAKSKFSIFASVVFLSDYLHHLYRSNPPEVFLGKGVLKICGKYTGKYPCRSVISIKLQSNFIEIALQHGYSPVNLLHIFRAPFLRTPLDGCLCL